VKVSKASLYTSLLITSSLLFAGCSAANTSTNSNKDHQATTEKQVTKSENHKNDKNEDSKSTTTTTKTNASKQNTLSSSALITKEKDKYIPNSPSTWKLSPSSQYQVTIDGRGEESAEEGQGTIVVENKKTLHSTLYSLPETIGHSLTPKYVEWKDDHILYVIIGYPYGTISKGGNLYELNIDTYSITPVIVNLPEKEEIISVYKNSTNIFMYKKNVYEDDNFTKSHIVEGIVPKLQDETN